MNDRDSTRRRTLTAVVFLAALMLTWTRIPMAVRGGFWAEDGRTFVSPWVNTPSFGLIWQTYAGYQQFIPRLASGLVVFFTPISWWANALQVVDCVVIAGISAVTFVLSRDVVRSLAARICLAAIPVILPLTQLEAIGNVANVHSYFIYAVPWLFLAKARSTAGAIGLALAAFSAAMTEPQTVVFLPLLVAALWRDRKRWQAATGWLAGIAIQGIGAPGVGLA